ncbi:MAG: cytochrome C oxidase subunit IV family protein [Gammaproteobacteria bacterium]|nr:cytochrome C oxidase subunit IV family protein [Gammaproteobacteria bacterium]
MNKVVLKVDIAWLMLILLTLSGGLMGKHAQPGFWITVVIAMMTFLKGRLVIDYFMELDEASKIIRRVVSSFSTIIPLLMILTYIWGDQLVSFSQSIIGQ